MQATCMLLAIIRQFGVIIVLTTITLFVVVRQLATKLQKATESTLKLFDERCSGLSLFLSSKSKQSPKNSGWGALYRNLHNFSALRTSRIIFFQDIKRWETISKQISEVLQKSLPPLTPIGEQNSEKIRVI